MAAAAENLLFALNSDLLCVIIGELPDARPAWRLLSTCRSIRIQLASQPLLSRPLLQLGSTDQDSYRWDRPPGYTDGDKWSWLVTYHQALAVMKTNACRVEVAFVGSHLAATASRVDAVVDFPCLLKHGGQSLQSLTLSGVTVDRLLRYYDEGLPLKELTLVGCSCNSSVGQHNTLGDRQNVLAALEQLQDLQALSLITTDVCSVRGLSKHPSLTSLTVGGEKWRHDDEDYMCSDDEDDDDIHSPDGMPDLAGIYKIPKLTHLDLSVGLEVGNTKGGFKVTPDYYRLIGKCTALTTLEIPVSGGVYGDGVLLSKYLTRCPRLEKIVLHMGRGWNEQFGEELTTTSSAAAPPSSRFVASLAGWTWTRAWTRGNISALLRGSSQKATPAFWFRYPGTPMTSQNRGMRCLSRSFWAMKKGTTRTTSTKRTRSGRVAR